MKTGTKGKATDSAHDAFSRVFGGGKNFMTPEFVSIEKFANRVAEISTGRGMDNQEIYGVTVIQFDDIKGEWVRDSDNSTMFQSLDEANNHIATLKAGE